MLVRRGAMTFNGAVNQLRTSQNVAPRQNSQRIVKNQTVLIAIDAPVVALELELALEEVGASTRSAASVHDALRLIGSETIDFAIVDTRVGEAATAAVMAELERYEIKFIMLSDGDRHDLKMPAVAAAVVLKPFVIEDLLANVRRFL